MKSFRFISLFAILLAACLLSAVPGARIAAMQAADEEQAQTDEESSDKIERLEPGDDEEATQSRNWKELARSSNLVRAAFRDAVKEAKAATVRIISDKNDLLTMGTIVDANGFVLTKASELHGDLRCELSDSRIVPASVYGIHLQSDLALLKIDAPNLPTIQWSTDEAALPVGSWLITPDTKDDELSICVVSVQARRVVPGGVLGVYLENDPKGVRIDRVVSGSPAEEVNIQVNDVVLAVNGTSVKSREELIGYVQKFAPGERIEIKILRGSDELTFRPVLGRRAVLEPNAERSNIQNRMGSELSSRRTGFESVIQHDTMLAPNQCGGVVVNIDGKAVGMNIARSGRIMSFAIPTATVLPILKQLLNGDFAPAIVNKSRLELIDKELAELDRQVEGLPTQRDTMQQDVDKLTEQIESLKAKNAELKKQLDAAAAELEKTEKDRNDLARELRKSKSAMRRIETSKKKLMEERAALEKGTFPTREED